MPPLPLPPPAALPSQFRAGDTLNWFVQTECVPASTVVLILTGLVANVPTRITIGLVTTAGVTTATAVDATGRATGTVPGAVTTTWAPGLYDWVLFATDPSGNREELSQGKIRILPDPAGAAVPDTRTDNRKMLDAIKTLLAGKVLDDVASYKIGERELVKMTAKELNQLEAKYAALVRQERVARGEKVRSRTFGVSFGGPR